MTDETVLTPAAEETPPAAEETPPAAEETPPAAEGAPEVKETPSEDEKPPAAGENENAIDVGAMLPEGVELSDEDQTVISDFFSETEITADDQKKIIEFLAAQGKDSQEQLEQAQEDAHNEVVKDWEKQITNDAELGGEGFEENRGIALGAIEKFGTPELKEILNTSGVGSHPEMFRFMLNVGKLLKEDNPGGSVSRSTTQKSNIEILYPEAKTN